MGNRQRVVEASLDRVSWAYDHTYQLVHEARSGTNAYNITHTWDPVGNRLVQNVGGTRTTVTYDKANEIIYSLDGAGRTTFLFDGAGNQVRTVSPALARTTYLWDGENRLAKVALPTSVINTMTYNADSLRVQKQDSTGTTKSIWDGQNILLDANASNVTQALYSLNPQLFGKLLSQSRSGTSSFFQFDALGSTAALASSLGSLTDTYLYKAFGEAVDGTGSTVNPFRFVGELGYVLDFDLGNYHLRARDLGVGEARFLSRDPYIRTRDANLYRYVMSMPTMHSDPSGMDLCFAYDWLENPANSLWKDVIECLCGVMSLLDIWLPPTGFGAVASILDCACSLLLDTYRTACACNRNNLGWQLWATELGAAVLDCAIDVIKMAQKLRMILEALIAALQAFVGGAAGPGPLGPANSFAGLTACCRLAQAGANQLGNPALIQALQVIKC